MMALFFCYDANPLRHNNNDNKFLNLIAILIKVVDDAAACWQRKLTAENKDSQSKKPDVAGTGNGRWL